ncbi:MAG: sulfatase family protein [Thermoguttaceae bacterium]
MPTTLPFAIRLLLIPFLCLFAVPAIAADRLNVLIITVDDMSADSLGAFRCKLPDTSPNIDRLAAQGMRFDRAHVVVGNCMPSRNVMWSGLYPHNNRVEGFYQVRDAKHLHLADLMKGAGYFTAIQHKVSHSTPYSPYPAWDLDLDVGLDRRRRDVKAPKSYGDGTAQGIAAARAAGKPFCLLINIADPHKPFYAEGKRGETIPDENVPSRVFKPEEVPVPGFLFDDPVVRKELSHYYSSVRRADDGVGEILAALDASGQRDRTLIVFLSDHGMPLPFAKTQVYHHSTRTPLFFIVPGVTRPGSVDNDHVVSTVHLLPTLLELTGIEHPGKMDGTSFASLLRGDPQEGRDWGIKEYNENAGGSRDPMRAIQTRGYLYIFNPWSNGQRIMATATTGTPTYRRMAELAETDPGIRARHRLYQFRVPEELYDVQKDPDCLDNLIDAPSHQQEVQELRRTLEQWMVRTSDPMLQVFRDRNDPAARGAYVAAQEKEAEVRMSGGKGKAKKAVAKAGRAKGTFAKRTGLIAFTLPQTVAAGKPVTVRIEHTLPADLGEQVLTVTLNGGPDRRRLDRKTVKASGNGVAEVTFDVPADVPGGVVSFAAFVGDDFQTSPQYLQTDPITTR